MINIQDTGDNEGRFSKEKYLARKEEAEIQKAPEDSILETQPQDELKLDGSTDIQNRSIPAINSDDDFNLALDDYMRMSASGESDGLLGENIKNYRGARFFNDGVDPVLSLEDKEKSEKMNYAADLSRDWTLDPEARKRVEQKKGKGWTDWYEKMDEDDKALIGSTELMKSLYDGDKDNFGFARYMKENNMVLIDATEKGIWSHFGGKVALADKGRAEEKARSDKALKLLPQVSFSLFNGERLHDAIKTMDKDDALWYMENFGVGSRGATAIEKAGQATSSLVYDDPLFGKQEFESNGKIVGEFVSRERNRAMTDMDKGNLDKLSQLKKESPEAYEILMMQIRASSDATHNAWYTIPGVDTAASTVTQGAFKFTDWAKRNALSPFMDTSISQQQSEVLGDLTNAADVYAPRDTDSVFRSWADPIGSMLGTTAPYLLNPWIGRAMTFGSVANDGYLKLKREGNNDLYSQWHSIPAAAGEAISEGLAFGKFGQILAGTKIFNALPLAGRVAGTMNKGLNVASSVESKIAANTAGRYFYSTAVGGTGEYMEEFISPAIAYTIDKAFSLACLDTEGGMSLSDVKEQWGQLSDPKIAAQMYLFAGMMSGVYIPAMRQDAKFLSQMPDWLQAAGVPEAKAKEIANITDFRERMEVGRGAIREGFANRSKEESLRSIAEAAERLNMADPLRPDMTEVEGLMQAGKIDRMTRTKDGTWEVQPRDGREAYALNEKQAAAYLTTQVADEGAISIVEARSLALKNALVSEMEESGKFVFEKMATPGETIETLKGLAKAAGIRIEELRSQGVANPEAQVDPSISENIPLGQIKNIRETLKERKAIAENRKEIEAGEEGISNAYRVRLNSAKTVIRFAEGRMNFSELLEEYYESKVSDSLNGTRTAEWWGTNLRESQKALRDMGIIETDFIKADGELSRLDILEGASFLGRAVAMNEAQKSALPESVRDFLRMLAAWTREALGLARLGKGFEVAAQKGHINKDFAREVYGLVGIQSEYWGEVAECAETQTIESANEAAFEASASFVKHEGKLFAPNGKESNLTPSQYEAVRTDAFKKWFGGDWEAKLIQDFMNGEPIASIEGKLFDKAGDAGKQLVEVISSWMKENYGESINNSVLGEVRLSGKDINDSWREGRRTIRAESFRIVPEIISNGIIIGNTENYKKREGLSRMLVAAPVLIDGSKNYGIVALQYDQNMKRMVFHDVYTVERTMLEHLDSQEKERAQALLSSGASFREEGQRSALDKSAEPVINILRRHLFVNTENVSKVVDENGEPLVVYHGAMDEFTKFDFGRAGENYQQYGQDEGFMFFSSIESDASYAAENAIESINDRKLAVAEENGEEDTDYISYKAARVLSVFLNLRNPLIKEFNENHLSIWDFHWQELRGEIVEGDEDYNDFDGCIFRGNDGVLAMATKPNQIKSATDNRGTFDPVDPDITFSLVGEGAANWGKIKHNAFEGIHDGKPRVELDASKAAVKMHKSGVDMVTYYESTIKQDRTADNPKYLNTLGRIFEFDELYKSYPWLSDVRVYGIRDKSQATIGFVDNYGNDDIGDITLNFANSQEENPFQSEAFNGDTKRIFLHEIQHIIQLEEGFEYGQGKDYWERPGELESRNVERRSEYSEESRRIHQFNETLELDASFSLGGNAETLDSFMARRSKNKAQQAFYDSLRKDLQSVLDDARTISATKDSNAELISKIHKSLGVVRAATANMPDGVRHSIRPTVAKLEMLAEMAATGKINATKYISDTARQHLMGELKKETAKEIEEAETTARTTAAATAWEQGRKKPTQKLTREVFERESSEVRKAWADEKADSLLAEMLSKIANKVTAHHKKQRIQSIRDLAKAVKTKKTASGRTKKGMMSADSFRKLHELIVPLFDEGETDLAGRRGKIEEEIKNLIDNEGTSTEEGLEQIARKMAEMTTIAVFGNLKGKTLDQIEVAHDQLDAFIRREKSSWEAVMDERAQKRKVVGDKMIEALPTRAKQDTTHKAKIDNRRLKDWGDAATIFQSVPQMLDTLAKYKGLEEFAYDMRIKLGRAFDLMQSSDKARQRRMDQAIATITREKSILKRNKFYKDWIKQTQTKIWIQPTETIKKTISVDEARLLASASKNVASKQESYSDEEGKLIAESLEQWEISEKERKEANEKDRKGRVGKRTIDIEYTIDKGEGNFLYMSKDNALNVIMLAEQESYRDLAERKGYKEGVLNQLRGWIGSQGLALKEVILSEYKLQGDTLAKEYERSMGVPFPRNGNYSPGSFYAFDKMSDEDATAILNGMNNPAGGKDGFLRQRVDHNREIDTTVGALGSLWRNAEIVDNWIYTHEIINDFRGILGRKETSQALITNIGRNNFATLKKWVGLIERAGIAQAETLGTAEKLTNRFFSTAAMGILSFRPETLIRQVDAVTNCYVGDPTVSWWEYMKELAHIKSGNSGMSWQKMANDPLIQDRTSGAEEVAKIASTREDGNAFNAFDAFVATGMNAMGTVDAYCNAIGATALYNIYYKRGQKQGLSHEECDVLAYNAVAEAIEKAAQPLAYANKSYLGVTQKGFGRSILFMGSENFNKVGQFINIGKQIRLEFKSGNSSEAWGLVRGGAMRWIIKGGLYTLLGTIISLIRDEDAIDKLEESDFGDLLASVMLGPLNGIPVAGEAMAYALSSASKAAGGKGLYIPTAGRSVVDFKSVYRGASKMLNDEAEDIDRIKGAIAFSQYAGIAGAGILGGKAGSILLAAAAASNIARTGANVVDKVDD